MTPQCRACGMEMWQLTDLVVFLFVCPRCDTTAVGGGYRHGPPLAPGTADGRFPATFGDLK